MKPTVVRWLNGSPVRPSYSWILPPAGISASSSRGCGHWPLSSSSLRRLRTYSLASRTAAWISVSVHPSKTGVTAWKPRTCAAQPRCVSRIWPTFMRLGTPSGLSRTSTGVPSSMKGMSSSGTMRAMTPLLPWRPAILSPADSVRLVAM